MKKVFAGFFVGVCVLLIVTVAYCSRAKVAFKGPVSEATSDTAVIEWQQLSDQTYDQARPFLNAIKPIYAEATLQVIRPYVYATEPRLKSYPMGKSSFVDGKVNSGIRDMMKRRINKRLSQIKQDVQNKKVKAAYVAVAKDEQDQVLGFMLLEECSVHEFLAPKLTEIIDGTAVKPDQTDQIFISLLAVSPTMQRRGIGRKLVTTICEKCPQVKHVYVATSANEFNKVAQTFCERVGFKKVLTGEFNPDYNDARFERKMILYCRDVPQK